ncbi:MAG: hypothetical protein FJ411_01585 [Verrucomicrobia bacterium]|nr:hypothetical protein [Verrucomicrobiota bacterium]
MAQAKKKVVRRPAPKALAFPPSSLAPQVLEQAAQGWLQSSGASAPAARPTRPAAEERLTEVLAETLRQLRAEIAELRARLDRLEPR